MKQTTTSERALVLAPRGRDAPIAVGMLVEAGIEASVVGSLSELLAELDSGAAFVLVTEEAIATSDLNALAAWIEDQEEWSDLPFVLLTTKGGGLERNPAAGRYLDVLGNVTFLERPFHPTTLLSLARAALRGRRRQYEARARLLALRESEARFRTLFETMDEGFAVIEFIDGPHGPLDDYVHVQANPAYERHTGIPNVVGQRVREMVPDEADAWIELYRGVLLNGQPIRFERELVATGRYLELAAFRVEPESRREVAVIFQDVTARKLAEKAQIELNETLEHRVADVLAERKVLADLVEGTDAFVQVADTEFRWLAVNKAAADEFERIYGIRPRAGDNMLETLDHLPEHREAVETVWRRALAGEAFTEIGEFGEPGRDRRFYEMKFDVLRGPAGEIIGAYQFVYDVTERLSEQMRLGQLQSQLHEAQKLETLGQLTGGVAHDVNNLLTPITGALDILSRRYASQDARAARLIDGALQSAERAKILVNRLLGFARRQALETQAIDVSALLDGMRDLVESSVGSTVELRLLAPNDLPSALADPNQLELALLNLCVNARDAMPDGGVLTVVAERAVVGPHSNMGLKPGAYVRLSVIDTGAGMDEATLAKAVEPFFSTKEIGKGTGLGLSMVHGLAAQLGGAFILSSAVGEGTRADLYLPVAAAPAEAWPRGASSDFVATRPLTLLLVDDEELVRAGTAEMLRDLGHTVVEAAGGAQALGKLGAGLRVDALITDYMMPRVNGGELAHRVGELYPSLPVLVVTGYAGGDLDLGLPQLAKPFRQADLAAALEQLIEAPSKVVRLRPKR